MLFVPKAVTPEIRALCQKILNGAGSPAFVRVQPEDDARPGDCFMNVQHKLKRAGGAIVYSWQIWERPHQFIEAEFHAVWGSPEGHLLDITPKHIPTRYILFLKDPHRTFEGKRIPNVRRV